MANRNRNKGYYRLLLSPGPPGIMVFFQIILAFLIIGVPNEEIKKDLPEEVLV